METCVDAYESIYAALKNEVLKLEPFYPGHKFTNCLYVTDNKADAATRYTIDERTIGGLENMVSAFVYQSNGSYTDGMSVDGMSVGGMQNLVREEENLVLLPKNLWSSVTEMQDEGITCCEVGWLLKPGHAITSKCIFSRNAELKKRY
ncbi:hypothetical protein Tco_1261718 [Tanacetum coccineum]